MSILTSFTRPPAAAHDLLQRRRELLAGAAPGGPEIDQDGDGARGLDDVLHEGLLVAVDDHAGGVVAALRGWGLADNVVVHGSWPSSLSGHRCRGHRCSVLPRQTSACCCRGGPCRSWGLTSRAGRVAAVGRAARGCSIQAAIGAAGPASCRSSGGSHGAGTAAVQLGALPVRLGTTEPFPRRRTDQMGCTDQMEGNLRFMCRGSCA